MDELDRRLLHCLQNYFPVSETPYQEIGNQLGISEEAVLERIRILKKDQIIRRIGAILDGNRLGYRSVLCAVKVPPEKVPIVASILNEFPNITHNYQRDHVFSVWFTFQEKETVLLSQLESLEKKIGFPIVQFPALKVYKREVKLDL